jgi:hypothetical protein
MELNRRGLGLATAVFAGASWFLVMSFSLLTGIGEITVTTIGAFHPFFSYSWPGMVIVVVEHLIGGFVAGWIFAWLYNRFSA